MALGLRREALGGLGMGVHIGQIGLDVIEGGAVHQISPQNVKHRPPGGVQLDPFQLHAGEPQRIGAERGAGGKNSHPGVAPQPGRADGGGPAVPHRPGKLPDQPDVAEFFQPPHCLGNPVFRLKDDFGPQPLHQAALPGDAELGGERGMNVRNDL